MKRGSGKRGMRSPNLASKVWKRVWKHPVASILAQYFLHRGANIRCLDTAPVNRTFSQYEAFCAEHLQLMSDGKVDYGSKNDVESKPVEWWARQDSNLRPPACEAGALTN